MKNRSLLLGASAWLVTTLCFGQVGEIARQLGLGTQLSDTKISSALKQALQLGAEQSVKLTGRPDGYFANPDIKILMPSNLRSLERGLRLIGYGPKVDDFVLSMNRAAEQAAPAGPSAPRPPPAGNAFPRPAPLATAPRPLSTPRPDPLSSAR